MDSYGRYQFHVYAHVHPDIDCEFCYPYPDGPYEYYDQIELKGRKTLKNVVKLADIRKGTA